MVGDPTVDQISIPGLSYQTVLSEPRMRERLKLRSRLNADAQLLRGLQQVKDNERLYGEAVNLLSSPDVISAFDLSRESDQMRAAYGNYRSGQACLLGRRLVEAGVPYINVIFNHTNRGQDNAPDEIEEYGWDTHNDIFSALQKYLLPRTFGILML